METQLLKGLLMKYLDMIEDVEERRDYFSGDAVFKEFNSKSSYRPLHSDFDRVGKLLRRETLEYENYFDREIKHNNY